eukprot:TRINITY_DN15075_c0_g1_i1.p1 TRINITY_DN15075_c0_g1~~TRINITY_DN15075_c0_g1_i1.p1  ORF type:complete len:1487 (-),score=267.22 TRINITY_DN15075_c0_g1_i1:141-4601(-)
MRRADGETKGSVSLTILTNLDGFQGRQHVFETTKSLDSQVDELCEKQSWDLESSSDDITAPVLMHGNTGFMLTDVELSRIHSSQELRLAADADEVQKCMDQILKDPVDVSIIESIAHNARPASRFLYDVVQRGGLQRLLELRPHESDVVEWEALLSAIAALLDDEGAQGLVAEKVSDRQSFSLTELCLLGFDARPSKFAISICIALSRHVLTLGDVGLAAIFRSETCLRSQGEDVSFARDVIELAVECGQTEALQLINDVMAQCTADGKDTLRFLREIRVEAEQVGSDEVIEMLLCEMPPAQRCRAAINFCVSARLQTASQLAGSVAAQAAREKQRQQELADTKTRLKKEQERLAKAGIEIRRLTTALHEIANFLHMEPPQLLESVQKLCAGNAWGTFRWRKQYSPLHLVAELGLVECIPLLMAFGADATAVDSKGRTAEAIAQAAGHMEAAAAIAVSSKRSTGEMTRTVMFGILDEENSRSSNCMRKIRRGCASFNYWRKRCCHRFCKLRSRELFESQGASEGAEGGDGAEGVGGTEMKTISRGNNSHDGEFDEETGLDALKDDKIEQFVKILENLGEEQLEKRLMAPPELGGLSLTEEEVVTAVAQVKAAAANKEESSAGSEGGKDGKGKGKGKGKDSAKGDKGGKGAGKGGKGGKGKKGGKAGGPTKPVFKPPHQMRPLWWARLLVAPGSDLSKSVWGSVGDFLDRMKDTDFGEVFKQPKNTPQKKDGEKEEVKKEKFLKFIVDPSILLSKQVAFSKLPTPDKTAEALNNLDTTVLTMDAMVAILDQGLATEAEIFLMKELRNAEPVLPWALPESYLWAISQVPMVRARLKCLKTITAYQETLDPVYRDLEEIRLVCQTLRASKPVKDYLACVIACGNYLNGGTNRGQADGCDIEQIDKLHLVKDLTGNRDLRYWLNLALSPGGCFADVGEKLLVDLEPLTGCVMRRLTKKNDGGLSVSKKMKGSLDDLVGVVQNLRTEFDEQYDLLQACLQSGDLDAVDPFRLDLPDMFEVGRTRFEQVAETLEAAKAEYKRVQAYFLCTVKSDEFFLMWDNALIGKDVMEMPAKAKTITAKLCLDKPLQYDQFVELWDMTEKPKPPRTPRFNKKKREESSSSERSRASVIRSDKRKPAVGRQSRLMARMSVAVRASVVSAVDFLTGTSSAASSTDIEQGQVNGGSAGGKGQGKRSGKQQGKGLQNGKGKGSSKGKRKLEVVADGFEGGNAVLEGARKVGNSAPKVVSFCDGPTPISEVDPSADDVEQRKPPGRVQFAFSASASDDDGASFKRASPLRPEVVDLTKLSASRSSSVFEASDDDGASEEGATRSRPVAVDLTKLSSSRSSSVFEASDDDGASLKRASPLRPAAVDLTKLSASRSRASTSSAASSSDIELGEVKDRCAEGKGQGKSSGKTQGKGLQGGKGVAVVEAEEMYAQGKATGKTSKGKGKGKGPSKGKGKPEVTAEGVEGGEDTTLREEMKTPLLGAPSM